MAIYTKTGDKGKTSTYKGNRVSKSSKLISAIGAIDELNSFLGVAKSFSDDPKLQKKIELVQANLFTINSILAGSKLRLDKNETKKLEKQIDKWEGELPVQKNFIYYGGTTRASLIFYARALSRKAERVLVSYSKEQKVSEAISIYMNRLSDYLFMLARSENFKAKIKEKFWKTSK